MSCKTWDEACKNDAIVCKDAFKAEWVIYDDIGLYILDYCPFCGSKIIPNIGCSAEIDNKSEPSDEEKIQLLADMFSDTYRDAIDFKEQREELLDTIKEACETLDVYDFTSAAVYKNLLTIIKKYEDDTDA